MVDQVHFKPRFAIALAFCAGLLAPSAGLAADAAAPVYAVMSLVGDNISTEVFTRVIASRTEGNLKKMLPIESAVFDQAAVQAANGVVKRQKPGVKTVLMVSADKELHLQQNGMFETVEANKANREYLQNLLKNRGASRLILITKYKYDAEFQVANEHIGSGKIEGLGFYIDNETKLLNNSNFVSANGYVAAYAYAKVRLIDAATLNVLKEVVVKRSDVNANYNAPTADAMPWDALTSAQKITWLQDVLGGAMDEAIPKLLAP